MTRVDIARAGLVALDFPNQQTALSAIALDAFYSVESPTSNLVLPSMLKECRANLEAAGLRWSEREADLTLDDLRVREEREFRDGATLRGLWLGPADARPVTELDGSQDEIEELELNRWLTAYKELGLKVYGKVPPHTTPEYRFVPNDATGIEVGDLVVQWKGKVPTHTNQYLRQVVEAKPPVFTLGPYVSRSHWPSVLRSLTSGSSLTVERKVIGDQGRLTVRRGDGTEVVSLMEDLARTSRHKRNLENVIGYAAEMARADASSGRRREFRIEKGGGVRPFAPTWVILDEKGQAYASEPRSRLAYRPPVAAHTFLAVVQAAYRESMKECLDAKAARDAQVAPEPVAPGAYR